MMQHFSFQQSNGAGGKHIVVALFKQLEVETLADLLHVTKPAPTIKYLGTQNRFVFICKESQCVKKPHHERIDS